MMQDNTLNSKVYGIPSKWSTCCWLADSLTTALMKSRAEDAHKKVLAILKIVVTVATELKEPTMLRELIFNLLTRIVRKVRYLLSSNP